MALSDSLIIGNEAKPILVSLAVVVNNNAENSKKRTVLPALSLQPTAAANELVGAGQHD